MYTSKSCILSRLLLLLAVVTVLGVNSCSADRRAVRSYETYRVAPADDGSKDDRHWSEYLEGQLVNRATDDSKPVLGDGGGDCLDVVVHVDTSLAHDYEVSRSGSSLTLAARDGGKMLWLVYQFLSSCSGGNIDVSDLPPAYVSMDGDEGDFAFEYRGIYTPSNSDPEFMPIMATGNVDYDWALWGHNLRKLFKDGIPQGACAVVGGKPTEEQFCFSSEELYKAVEAYVIDYGGDAEPDETARFAIMPADNKLVCQCAECVKAGNTAASATPAVSRMLRRLAGRFPRCTFFTSSYHTTAEPPESPMPSNVGVLVSAVNVPMRSQLGTRPQAKQFAGLVKKWSRVVSRVYVWDYMRNYDDYFTPYPCLKLLQERLRMFRSLGVKGVFYNGSSPYYASFDDVQTAVLAAMLVNPDLPVEQYAGSCFERYYPVAAPLLSESYLSWENTVAQNGRILPFYGSIAETVHAWLDPDAYVAYCNSLDRLSKRAAPLERARLNRLLTATWLTRLELLRNSGRAEADPAMVNHCIDGLRGYASFPDMSNYRETGGPVDKYIEKWEKETK